MIELKLNMKLKCLRHPRYNPATMGEEFQASCKTCESMYYLHKQWLKILGQKREYDYSVAEQEAKQRG